MTGGARDEQMGEALNSEWYMRELARMRRERLTAKRQALERQRAWAKLEAQEQHCESLGRFGFMLRLWYRKWRILGGIIALAGWLLIFYSIFTSPPRDFNQIWEDVMSQPPDG